MTRPACEVSGCDNLAQAIDGGNNPRYRKSKWVREEHNAPNGWVCSRCHGKRIAKKHGVKNLATVIANNAGYSTSTEYLNDKHPYRWYLNSQPTCENVDGRLGFVCTTTTFPGYGMVDVDHIDGNPTNNDRENLQTLCKCCHAYKTNINEDFASPGRKALGVKY